MDNCLNCVHAKLALGKIDDKEYIGCEKHSEKFHNNSKLEDYDFFDTDIGTTEWSFGRYMKYFKPSETIPDWTWGTSEHERTMIYGILVESTTCCQHHMDAIKICRLCEEVYNPNKEGSIVDGFHYCGKCSD